MKPTLKHFQLKWLPVEHQEMPKIKDLTLFSDAILDAKALALLTASILLTACGGAQESRGTSTEEQSVEAAQNSVSTVATVAESSMPKDAPWTLVSDASHVAFGSIKSDLIGEAHRFENVTGKVDQTGAARIEIDLASVETNVEIRNERMRDMLFEVEKFPNAIVTANIDIDSFADLAIGEKRLSEPDLTLSLHGVEAPVYASLSVTRVAEDRLLVATEAPLFIAAEDFELGAGIDALREAAGLPSITPVSPITVSLLFEQ